MKTQEGHGLATGAIPRCEQRTSDRMQSPEGATAEEASEGSPTEEDTDGKRREGTDERRARRSLRMGKALKSENPMSGYGTK
jgi:hypothetical protein